MASLFSTLIRVFASLIVLISCPVGRVLADYPSQAEGFRDVGWGAHIEELSLIEFELVEEGASETSYRMSNDRLFLGEFPLEQIEYVFYQDRFVRVKITARGGHNCTEIRTLLIQRHGGPHMQAGVIYQWGGSKTSISFFEKDRNSGCLLLVGSSAYIQKIREQEERREHEERLRKLQAAEKDF